MTDEATDNQFASKVQALIANAVAALDPADCAERVAYCLERNEHGVRMFPDPDGLLEFRWGGRRLAMVRAADLDTDEPLRAEFIAEDVPDTLPDDWGQ